MPSRQAPPARKKKTKAPRPQAYDARKKKAKAKITTKMSKVQKASVRVSGAGRGREHAGTHRLCDVRALASNPAYAFFFDNGLPPEPVK